ncbi:putative cas1 domain-containing protein 1 protein [Lasiodiplodia theobromae]|uniref:Cas1 domain-containing protein 1 protein n=1 Tax=Lasiodiplodia theobromae TaxID=45133 RepID=A0A8H7IRC9_9PEZI|nr:putative cas1 domain-containing protein 1 protein [Lasiodiplodia theobromae]
MHFSAIVVAVICASSPLVAGHAAIIGAQGDAGGNGSAIGIVGSTPRDGTRRNPFQADATRFRGDAADTCGETIGAGTNDVESGTQQVLAASGNTLPQVSPGGQLQMTLHQVNSDGAGPYTCMIDPTGTGTQWTQINVAQNVPGSRRGRNRDGEATDFSLVADMPAGMSCTGTVAGQTNVCMSTSGQADSAAADAADRENEAEDEAEDRAVKVIQRRVKINLVA